LLDVLVDFLADFLADFFVDLLDFFDLLEDLERADVLAMNHLIERVLDNLARSFTAVRRGSAAVATPFHVREDELSIGLTTPPPAPL
jgi:hypothetical protein